MFRGSQEFPIQGPNSKIVKYNKIICANCNNNFSQPFDKADDTFRDYVVNNESLILKRRFIDFREVYGDDFESYQRNLFKYFVKSFGCRLADNGYLVPEDLPTLLSKKSFRTALKITFSVDEDYLDFDFKILANGELIKYVPEKETCPTWLEKIMYKKYKEKYPPQYQSSENFNWLTTWFWYNLPPEEVLGSSWIANTQYIYLGSHERLSSEKRQELLKQKHNLLDKSIAQ